MSADLDDWLDGLSKGDLVDLVRGLVSQVDGVGDWLALQQLRGDRDPLALRAEVDGALTPRSGFYSYQRANEYSAEAEGVVTLLVEAAGSPDLPLVSTIERAVTLVTRTVLRADDSSGWLGHMAERLLAAHATAVCGLSDVLTAKERRRIADWLVNYRYGGKQDYFDPDIVAYAPGLGDVGVARYRAAIADQDLGRYGRYPLERLAVLDKDPVALVAAHGGEPANARLAQGIVEDLLEAGLDEEARRYAHIGLSLPAAAQTPKLVRGFWSMSIAASPRGSWRPATLPYPEVRTVLYVATPPGPTRSPRSLRRPVPSSTARRHRSRRFAMRGWMRSGRRSSSLGHCRWTPPAIWSRGTWRTNARCCAGPVPLPRSGSASPFANFETSPRAEFATAHLGEAAPQPAN